ncbi:26s proteasome non-atpase regulatory subunit 9 [Lichtheimia corymbifera JMRC:FSU:9682]|uniref:Probable 26S proteasome regulatory subunit p27 n=1 Tax=Lichtheimia corymbifera JMRC:FSU:9682 TaxID=1263082 RepID=A0A068RKW2_9FUNG|nr:26s proteasome non-atpase regulatory subunit 9 [Lichtheimia corymbifera JMRC:FSU:9682]
MGLPPPKMSSNDLLADAQQLIKKKDDIEAQLRELEESLRIQGVGMDQPLVDAGGFPRSDIDVVAARTSRNLIHRLRNDHKDIMKEIEQALHAIHQASREEKEKAGTPPSSSSTDNRQQEVSSSSSTTTPSLVPFARVNAVAPDSPAYEAGLRREDKLIKFGSIHAANHDRLQALNQLVGRSEGIPISVIISRGQDDQQQSLTLTPRQGWGGRGTLGCHIVPL